jgi:hypothetical protein
MAFLSALFRKKMSAQEMIEQVGFFLSPQIKVLEARNVSYEHILGQKAIYYIRCLAQEIASRDISEEEFGMLLIYLMGKDKAFILIGTYLHTKEHSTVHNEFMDALKPIAIGDKVNRMITSRNFLIEHFEVCQKAAQDIYYGR